MPRSGLPLRSRAPLYKAIQPRWTCVRHGL